MNYLFHFLRRAVVRSHLNHEQNNNSGHPASACSTARHVSRLPATAR
jgi:hypothetical protein